MRSIKVVRTQKFACGQAIFFCLLTVAGFWLFTRQLPIAPVIASDSASYLESSPIVPHGYPLFLAAYQRICNNLDHLPATQAAIYLASIAFLSIAIARRVNSLFVGVVLFLTLYGYLTPSDVWSVMSEPLYAGAVTAGIASLIFYTMRATARSLFAASMFFGIAIVCRTIGYALLPAFFLVVWCNNRRGDRFVRACVLTVLPMALISGLAATSNLIHNGSFAIGSWGGVSILGKGLVLARPLPDGDPQAQLNWTSAVTLPVREVLGRVENPFLRAMIQRQYYEYLRWWIAWPRFEQSWDAWKFANKTERNRLATQLATTYLTKDVPGYLGLVGFDYLSLWPLPRYLTASEEPSLRSELFSLGPLPYLSTLAELPEGKNEYYQIIPKSKTTMFVYLTRSLIASFWGITITILWCLVRHFWYTVTNVTDLLFIILAVHKRHDSIT